MLARGRISAWSGLAPQQGHMLAMNGLFAGLKSLGPMRLVAMVAVAIGMFATIAVLATQSGSTPMVPLYANLDLKDAAQIIDALDTAKILHDTDQGGARVLVPGNQLDAARLALAKVGLPSGGSVGWEIFDKSTDMLSESQFQQNINQTRALEGELSRTIALISGIRAARVNLVLPSREPFSRDQQQAQASVLLTTMGAGSVDRESVQAILNLVATAVPGLKIQNIAIVDSAGDLLARAGEPLDGVGSAQSSDEMRRATEVRLDQAVEEMLGRTLGPDHVRAQASVEMNFDHSQQTTEKYDPDQQMARSTQTITNNSKSTDDAPQNVSVQNNLPNAVPASSGGGSTEQHQEEVNNYEIGKTVSTLVHDQPQISRISLAVMVDGTTTIGADGKSNWQPMNATELADITSLVKSAIGFDQSRGDRVDVISMPFLSETPAGPKQLQLLGVAFDKSDLMRLSETALIGMLTLCGLLFVVRPTLLRLTATPHGVAALGQDADSLALPGANPAITGPGGAMLSYSNPGQIEEDDDLVSVANIEGQLRASSIRRLSNMVDKEPDATLSIIRSWIMAEQN